MYAHRKRENATAGQAEMEIDGKEDEELNVLMVWPRGCANDQETHQIAHKIPPTRYGGNNKARLRYRGNMMIRYAKDQAALTQGAIPSHPESTCRIRKKPF